MDVAECHLIFQGESAEGCLIYFGRKPRVHVVFIGTISTHERIWEVGDATRAAHVEVACHIVAGGVDRPVTEGRLFVVKCYPIVGRQVPIRKRRSITQMNDPCEWIVI